MLTLQEGGGAAIVSHFNNIDSTDSNPFSDVDSGHWAFTNISSAHAKGWINGYPDGTFRPGNSITRAEAVTIVNAVLSRKSGSSTLAKDINPYNDLKSDHWAYAGIIEASVTND